jgi:hypothetical protein
MEEDQRGIRASRAFPVAPPFEGAMKVAKNVAAWMAVLTLPVLVAGTMNQGSSAQAQQSYQAKVLSATTGAWQVKGQALLRNATVSADDRANTTRGGELIVNCSTGGVFIYACPNACELKVCNGEHQKPDRSASSSAGTFLGNLSAFATALLTREPKEPVQAYSRTSGVPNDAVLLRDERGVHWGGAFDRVLEGKYCLSVSPLQPAASSAATIVSIEWDRERDGEGVVQAPNLRPGLYGLRKGTPAGAGCSLDTDGTTAWVLIPSPAESQRLSDEWKKSSQSLEELQAADLAESTIVTIRHTVLAGLADSLVTR